MLLFRNLYLMAGCSTDLSIKYPQLSLNVKPDGLILTVQLMFTNIDPNHVFVLLPGYRCSSTASSTPKVGNMFGRRQLNGRFVLFHEEE